jgi:hypothetical protein
MRGKSTSGSAADHTSSGSADAQASGLSAFLGRVFGQLSLSSWLPAAMFVGNAAVLVQLGRQANLSLAEAIEHLTGQPLGVVIVLAFALVLTAMIAQAFEFELIRLLEGYTDSVPAVLHPLVAGRIRSHGRRRAGLERERGSLEREAFLSARLTMRVLPGYDRRDLDVLEDRIFGIHVDDTELQRVAHLEWRVHAPAELLHRLEAVETRLDLYPQPSRILPTRLGNALRAVEDRLPLEGDENVEGFVLRHFDAAPGAIRQEHDDYRKRLEMYCTLSLIFVFLAGVAAWSFSRNPLSPWYTTAAAAGGYLVLAWISYEAAVASAKGLSGALLEIAGFVEELDEPDVDESPRPWFLRLLHRDAM